MYYPIDSRPELEPGIWVLAQLEQAGYRGYLVGGCVRDCLLGRPIHDIDVATSATPEIVQRLFSHTVPTGLQHGTVSVIEKNQPIEVTTFRREGPYEDGRRPDYVTFVSDIETDLSRRDFTINALAMDRCGAVIDPFGGRKDLQKQQIRAVGDPQLRFREDGLRILRAVRFSAQLDFSITAETQAAMKHEKARLRSLAIERITAELSELIAARHPGRALRLLWTLDLLLHIPPLSTRRDIPGPTNDRFAQFNLEKDIQLRWILFLRMCGIPSHEARSVCRSLRMSRKQQLAISQIWEGAESWHDHFLSVAQTRKMVYTYGLKRMLKISRLAFLFKYITEADWRHLRKAVCHADWDLPLEHDGHLALSGHDLMSLASRRQGPWIGAVRRALIDRVVQGKTLNHPKSLEREWRIYGPYAP